MRKSAVTVTPSDSLAQVASFLMFRTRWRSSSIARYTDEENARLREGETFTGEDLDKALKKYGFKSKVENYIPNIRSRGKIIEISNNTYRKT